jgi:hypothetical protein
VLGVNDFVVASYYFLFSVNHVFLLVSFSLVSNVMTFDDAIPFYYYCILPLYPIDREFSGPLLSRCARNEALFGVGSGCWS